MTFAALKLDVYRRLNYATSPASDVVTRIAAYLNETHEEILSHPSLRSLLYGTMTFNSIASTPRYGLSFQAQVLSLIDTANQITLQPRTLEWYRAYYPDPSVNTGTPLWYIPLGQVLINRQPSINGTGLWVVSTSAADVAITVNIDGIRVGGSITSVAVTTLNGLTRVAVGGAGALTDYIDVTQFALSAAAAGDVALMDAAVAGNTLATIPAGQTTIRKWGFYLAPTPSAALTYTVDLEHELFPLTADTDEPLLPQKFHRLLAMGARMKEYEKTSDERYATAKDQFDAGLRDLRYQVAAPPGLIPVMGQGQRVGRSRLGANYPADSWSWGG